MNVDDVSIDDQLYILKFMYIAKLFWDFNTSIVRFSALAFYGRVFRVRSNPNRWWRIFYYIVCTTCILWLAGLVIFDAFLTCRPIQAFWEGHFDQCVGVDSIYMVGTAGNFGTDILVLLLPLPPVLSLNIKWHKRLAISLSFILGYA